MSLTTPVPAREVTARAVALLRRNHAGARMELGVLIVLTQRFRVMSLDRRAVIRMFAPARPTRSAQRQRRDLSLAGAGTTTFPGAH